MRTRRRITANIIETSSVDIGADDVAIAGFIILGVLMLIGVLMSYIGEVCKEDEKLHFQEKEEREPWMQKYLEESSALKTIKSSCTGLWHNKKEDRSVSSNIYTFKDGVELRMFTWHPSGHKRSYLVEKEGVNAEGFPAKDEPRFSGDNKKYVGDWFLHRMMKIAEKSKEESSFRPCKNNTPMYNHRGYKLPKEY